MALACATGLHHASLPPLQDRDVDTLIVSDLHLGLPAARPRDLLQVLHQWRFHRVILLGEGVY